MSNLILTVSGQSAYNYMGISNIRLQVSWLYGFKFTLDEKKIVNELELIRLKPIENRMQNTLEVWINIQPLFI